jgi:hypothetical protein
MHRTASGMITCLYLLVRVPCTSTHVQVLPLPYEAVQVPVLYIFCCTKYTKTLCEWGTHKSFPGSR